MTDYYSDLLIRYRTRGALIDTNLLLVYFVGSHDPKQIGRFKRTQAYTEYDFYLLASVVIFFSKIITTPNVLTEVNSLSNQLPESIKPAYYREFARRVTTLDEHFMGSRQISLSSHFARFGLTDSGIIELVRGNYLIITDDLRLSNYCQKIGVDVINFNHIRSLRWNP